GRQRAMRGSVMALPRADHRGMVARVVRVDRRLRGLGDRAGRTIGGANRHRAVTGAPGAGASGRYVGVELSLEQRDLVLEKELAFLEALQLELILGGVLREPDDHVIEVPVFGLQLPDFLPESLNVGDRYHGCHPPSNAARKMSIVPPISKNEPGRATLRSATRRPRPLLTRCF